MITMTPILGFLLRLLAAIACAAIFIACSGCAVTLDTDYGAITYRPPAVTGFAK